MRNEDTLTFQVPSAVRKMLNRTETMGG